MGFFYDRYGTMSHVEATAADSLTLFGEHTAYNDGFVLAMALPQETTVALARTGDDQVVVTCLRDADHADSHRYRLGDERPGGDWYNVIHGATVVLREAGHAISGFQALIRSTATDGSGPAGNPTLTVSLLRALRQAFDLTLDDVAIARLAQRVAIEFDASQNAFTAPLLASCGRDDAVLCLDTKDLTCRHSPLPGADVIVIHSGVVDRNAGNHHHTRRQECRDAAATLGLASLRDLGPADMAALADLPDTLRKRARHVFSENARILAALDALQAQDAFTLGHLLMESHRSVRDDYEATVPEIDLLFDLLRFEPSVYGARMTGGGFGGSVVALVEAGLGRVMARKIARRYAEQSDREPTIMLPV
jgi:galactokinase